MKLNQAAGDTASAAAMIPNIRSFIATASDSAYAGIMRQMLLRALVTSRAPVKEIALAADSTIPYLGTVPRVRVPFFASVGGVIAQRGGDKNKALSYARRAIAELPEDDDGQRMRPFAIQNLGYVHLETGSPDSAIVYLNLALPATPDSQGVLLQLGRAYTQTRQLDAAIDVYLRSLAVFPGQDTTGMGVLRATYVQLHGNTKGLDEKIAAARRASAEASPWHHAATSAPRPRGPSPASTANPSPRRASPARSPCSTSGARGVDPAASSCRSSKRSTSATRTTRKCASSASTGSAIAPSTPNSPATT